MPRKVQRYSRLLQELRATGGTPTGTGRAAKFHDFIVGNTKLTQSNKMPKEGRELYQIAVIPFGVSASGVLTTERYVTTISLYSLQGLISRANASEANFGIYKIEGGEQVNPNFYPALLKVRYSSSTATTVKDKKSAITGDEYDYTYGRTFSFPFGRTTSNVDDAESGTSETSINDVDEIDVLRSLRTKLGEGTGTTKPLSVSYDPEKFRPANSGAAPYKTGITLPNVTVS